MSVSRAPQSEIARSSESSPLRFIIIGAGLSGIMSAIKLAAAGYTDITIFEKAANVGGTWRDNTYPGVACDIPSHFYSYSFAPNPEWSHRYAPGAEIQKYIEAVVQRFDVHKRIRFGATVTRCEFVNGRWQVQTDDGHCDVADVIIAATGITHQPQIPNIAGLQTFAGAAFHSARWNHDAEIDHRRIGIIGTGSSAVQLVSALVKRARELTLFQRTAQWVMPQENASYSEDEKLQFRTQPESLQSLRAHLARRFTENVSNAFIDAESPQLKAIEQACLKNLQSQVSDLALRARLQPNYRAACKRLVISPDFYQAMQQPNANLVTDAIERVEAQGVRTSDGKLHELDVLVLATGFNTDRFMRPMEIIGRNQSNLNELWSKRPRAYMTVAIPEFPNFFMLNGPNSPAGNFPLIEVAELQMQYVLQLIEGLRSGNYREIAPRESSVARFDADRIAATQRTVWVTGCNSWYLDADGIPAVWPWSIERFYRDMSAPNFSDYECAK